MADQFRVRLREWAKSSFKKPHLETLSDAADLNYAQVASWGEGKLPSGPSLIKLAQLGLNIDWLLTGRGEMSIISASSAGVTISPRQRLLDSISELAELAEYLPDTVPGAVEEGIVYPPDDPLGQPIDVGGKRLLELHRDKIEAARRQLAEQRERERQEQEERQTRS
jgi:hypothetical protein